MVAWGGMLFLLLVEAAPAMCNPTCNDLYSARRICPSPSLPPSPYPSWSLSLIPFLPPFLPFLILPQLIRAGIETDSQILNALFCVTGLGLLPWRARDLYLLFRKNYQKLAVIHQGWYIHGVTKVSLLYWVIWLFIMNSLWQIAVSSLNSPEWSFP